MSDLLTALATVIRQPIPKEFCADCGAVFPAGSHVWTDLDGEEHPACLNYNRAQAHLFGMRQFMGCDEPEPGRKRAKGYAVK